MKRIKKFVALALAATMMVAPASTAFAAKSAQTGSTVPSTVTSTVGYTIDIPMIKVDDKWKIDPAFAYIGIKNIKWNSIITDMEIKKPKKLGIDVNTKYAPYALLLKQKGTIVPTEEPLKTPNIKVTFWVKVSRQKILYTRHEVNLRFVRLNLRLKCSRLEHLILPIIMMVTSLERPILRSIINSPRMHGELSRFS